MTSKAAGHPTLSEILRADGRAANPMFVASTGGHLEEAYRIAASVGGTPTWITFRLAQSDSMLSAEQTDYVAEVKQRDIWGAIKAFVPIFRSMRKRRPSCVVSTGAAVAVPAFLAARLLRIPTVYIESNSRVLGPSMTGKTLAWTRLASQCVSQHDWTKGRWVQARSILDDFQPQGGRDPGGHEHSIFITIGTVTKYPFNALVASLAQQQLADESTVWQLAETAAAGVPGVVHDYVSSQEFDEIATNARTVVSHAGMGSILRLLELGIYPVLVIRRARRGEHVDDHQEQIAEIMRKRGLALVVEADELTGADLELAATMRVSRIAPVGPSVALPLTDQDEAARSKLEPGA